MVSFSSTLFRTVAWFKLVSELLLCNYIRLSLNRTGLEAKAQQKVREEARKESKAVLKLQLGARRLELTLPLCAFCIINTTDSFIFFYLLERESRKGHDFTCPKSSEPRIYQPQAATSAVWKCHQVQVLIDKGPLGHSSAKESALTCCNSSIQESKIVLTSDSNRPN